ncbi:MAG: malate/lactate/ureidoglycolate dehydrogenase [Pseudomonadales bacterium]|nr:malate/lactate/ureidoglycolate dehydrogenase [Pseudomonadales bacterium]
MNIKPDNLCQLTSAILVAAGSPLAEANIVADHLVEANLKGHDSHGVGMLPTYVHSISKGFCVPQQHIEVVSQTGSNIIIDAKLGFGQVTGLEAMDQGIQIAKQQGIAVVALKNAHHLGRIGGHAEHVVQQGLISMHYVNVVGHDPQVSPFGGTLPRLGTNPFCCAIPVLDGDPVILDMATSAIAAGKVRVARNSGLQVPDGCLIDHAGNETTDPNVVMQDPKGSQTHFGKHKGFGLALICELLAGALIGGWSSQPDQPRPGTVVNHMLTFILDPEVVGDTVKFATETGALLEYMKSTPTATGVDAVLIPGEPERIALSDREINGITLDTLSWESILQTADRAGLSRDRIETLST